MDKNLSELLYWRGPMFSGCGPLFSGNALDFRPKFSDAHSRFLLRFKTARFNINKIKCYFSLIPRHKGKISL